MTTKTVDLSIMNESQLLDFKRKEEINLARMEAALEVRERYISAPAGANKYFDKLASGDASTLNNVIWPGFMVIQPVLVSKNGGVTKASFQVSGESCFIWTSLIKTVFKTVDFDAEELELDYINPSTEADGDANGLTFQMVDAASSRAFMSSPIPLDNIALPERPFYPDRPQMFLPMQIIEIEFSNENPNFDFIPMLVFQGYKMRLENQQDLYDMVTE